MNIKSTVASGAIIILAIGGVAACGSSGKKSSSSNSSSNSSSAPTGSTLKVVTVLNDDPASGFHVPEVFEGVQAAVKNINDNGGLNGHKLVATKCLSDYSVDQSTTCVNGAVKDSSVIAIVGQVVNESASTDPLLEKAGLASVGPYALSTADYQSKNSFPVGIGALSDAGAASLLADQLHGKQLSSLYLSGIPAIKAAIAAANAALAARGLPPVKEVGVSPTKQDVSAEAAQVLQGSDGMVPALDQGTLGRFLRAEQTLGKNTPVAADAFVAQEALHGLGISVNNLYAVSAFMPPGSDGAGVKTMEAQLDASGAKKPYDSFHEYGWVAMQLLKAAVGSNTNITRASVLSGLNNLTSFSVDGLTPTIDLTKQSSALGGTVPRLFNSKVIYCKMNSDGSLKVLNTQYVDAFAKPSS